MRIEEMRSIKIDVNLNAMMKNFGEVFSGERIWIRELLQNARRAGATRINIHTDRSDPNYFRIDDNGSGVSDFQSLLTLGGSGWEPEVIERENPFGLGFYAALYAAVIVEIRSRGQRAVLHSGRILSGEPIALQPCDLQWGTSIILHLKKSIVNAGKKNKIEKLKEYLEVIVCGFPVPVHLNGVPLSRPYAPDVWKGLRFELPEGVALVDLSPENIFSVKGMTFLQGLAISNGESSLRTWPSFSRRGMRVYMHLHADQWRVRVPDRDRLYDSTETWEKIRALENGLVRAVADHIVSRGEAEKYFECLLEWGCYEAIRNLPIPQNRWCRMTSPTHLPHFESEDLDYAFGSVPVAEIPSPENEGRFIRDWSHIYVNDDTLDHLFAAYLFGVPILDTWNDSLHWFSRAASGEGLDDFYARKISVTVEKGDIAAEGSWWGKRVVICRRFSLTLEGYGTREITEDAFLDGAFWIIDRPLHYHYPIDQAFFFQTQGEDFDESGFDAAMENFRANLAIIKGDPGALIQSALREYAQALDGSRFVVEVKEGEIQVKELPMNK